MGVLTTRGRSGAARARNFTSKMEMLISILSEKGVRIVPGKSPATDCKSTVFMPWIKEDATEEDFLKYFCSAAHEQAHLHGKSNTDDLKGKPKMHGFCINAVEDIRVEYLQEQEYPGLVGYRRREMPLDTEGFLKKEFESASSGNIKDLIVAMLKYMIIKNRARQLKAEEEVVIHASEDLVDYYNRYLADLEDILDGLDDSSHAVRVGTEVYKRLKDLLVDDELEKSKDAEPEEGEEGDESEDGEKSEGKSKSKPKEDESDDSGEGEDSDSGEGELSDDGSDGEDSDSGEGEDSDDGSDGGELSDGCTSKSDDDSHSDPEDTEEKPAKTEEELKAEEEARREAAEAKAREDAEKRAEEILKEMEDRKDLKTIADKRNEHVSAIADADEGGYYTANGVKDIVRFETPNEVRGLATLMAGKKLLGSVGSRMTKLFVSQTKERNLYNQRRGRFDMKAFNADVMDRRGDVYSSIVPGSLDKAAVCFAVDNSGSMRGERIQKAYHILSGLLYYLDKAGIPTEAIGFTAELSSGSCRNGAVRHTIIKTYDESFNKKVISRCYAPIDMEQNVEIEALRYLAPRLNQRPEAKKIMFVLSDGDPYFAGPTLNRKMAVAYKAYIKGLRSIGFKVIGFGIDCNVSEYFGDDCINTKTDNLGDAIVKKLTEILNGR